MDKMRMESEDIQQDNVAKIAALFPNCVTEARDEDGHLKKAINFEMLKQMLSDSVIDGDEAYEFTWVGKKASIVEANRPIRKTLRPVKADSVNWDTTENLYIEGDNLEVLKLLQESYLGKVKMIYIDPPYNTGNDFIYNDDFKMSSEDYADESGEVDAEGNRMFKNTDSNGRFHSDWCSMIYSRLMLARNLLSKDGVIFISIDEHEDSNLKKICDEIYGRANYIGDIVWESTTQPINVGSAQFGLQKKTEPIIVYAKQKENIKGFVLKETDNGLKYPHVGKYGPCRFEIIEKSDAGSYSRPSMKFQILGQYPREGKRWQIGEETARQLEREGKVEIVDGIVKKAVYPEDEKDKKQYVPFWSFFDAKQYGTAQTGKDELNKVMETAMGFDTVKPIALIKSIIFHMGENNIILDFFSGSATTAHAVMQLNAEDGGHRKFIIVQLPEETDEKSEAFKAGYKNICEIGKERIRRAAKKIHQDNPDATFDDGFRVLKLDDTNMKDVYYAAGDYSQDLVSMFESNVKPDRTDLDLLFGCLLDWGLPLSLPYTSEIIDGCKVHTYNDGDLIACFDENVPESVIKTIAKRQPLRAVFRDTSFANSPAKINVGEIFKLLAPDTRVKVI